MAAFCLEIIRADQRGNARGKLKTMAARKGDEPAPERFGRGKVQENGGVTLGGVGPVAMQRKRRERLLITTKLRARGEGQCGKTGPGRIGAFVFFGKGDERKPIRCSKGSE